MTRHVHLRPPWLAPGGGAPNAIRRRDGGGTAAHGWRTDGVPVGGDRGGGRTSPRRMDVAGVSCLRVRRHRERWSEGRIRSLMSNSRPKGVDVDGERMW